MTNTIDSLINEISEKHHITIGRDDPILILQTINARLLEESTQAQQENLNKYKSEMEEMMVRWESEVKLKAERVLNASLTASKNMTNEMLEVNTSHLSSSLRKEIDCALEKFSETVNTAKKLAILNITAASITLLSAIVWEFIFHFTK